MTDLAALQAMAFDQRTKDWLAERPDYELQAISAFEVAHEKPLEYDCSDGPNLVLDTPGPYERMYEEEYSCCGWALSRMRLEDWDLDLIVGSCYGH